MALIREKKFIGPQGGPQEAFLDCEADIAIYGGAMGGGKTYALILQWIMYMLVRGFSGVIFRKTETEVLNVGGIWDESMKILPYVGAKSQKSELQWFHPVSRATFQFRNLENEDRARKTWQGPQVCYMAFDELTQYSESLFWYLNTRNRSTCGVKPFIRASCNPINEDDPIGGWVHKLLQWWIDPETGFPIDERTGVIRYVARINDEMVFGDTREELIERYGPETLAKSLTFFPATLDDNLELKRTNPEYAGNLSMLPDFEQERYRRGNWNARLLAGMFFKTANVKFVSAAPIDLVMRVRSWDLAATEGAGDFTVGIEMGVDRDGRIYVLDVVRGQWEVDYRDKKMSETAHTDGKNTYITVPDDPGAAGTSEAARLVRLLFQFPVIKKPKQKDTKALRARGFAAQFNAGNVYFVVGEWNRGLLARLDAFPKKGVPDDEIDALSDGYSELEIANNLVVAGVGRDIETTPDDEKVPDHPFKSMIERAPEELEAIKAEQERLKKIDEEIPPFFAG